MCIYIYVICQHKHVTHTDMFVCIHTRTPVSLRVIIHFLQALYVKLAARVSRRSLAFIKDLRVGRVLKEPVPMERPGLSVWGMRLDSSGLSF